MSVDTAMERIYDRVELVRGVGDRWRGHFCLMSFVALLSGEAHTDHPRTVSPVIRRFGIVINDEMPSDMRQRLKPFAPRIMGTRDGLDKERAQFLLDAWRIEIVPQLLADFGVRARLTDRRTEGLLACPLIHRDNDARDQLATAIARLIAHYAHTAPYRTRDWYWLKAIDLLDRLADIRNGEALAGIASEKITTAMQVLERGAKPRFALTTALNRIRSLMPVGKD
jgi:hypothetical protein